jgi:hypothetical protein
MFVGFFPIVKGLQATYNKKGDQVFILPDH